MSRPTAKPNLGLSDVTFAHGTPQELPASFSRQRTGRSHLEKGSFARARVFRTMSEQDLELEAFSKFIVALEPWLGEAVLIGGQPSMEMLRYRLN